MSVDLDQVRADWVGREFDQATFVIDRQHLLDWAVACGETDPRFSDPDHPDFQAQPAFPTQFSSKRMLPEGFPDLGSGAPGIDGGKSIELFGPIRAGDVLTAVSMIGDIYPKTGRSGTMIFTVHRMVFRNQHGDHVATVDTKMIKPARG